MSRHRLIIGIDYGTTFSGISIVTTDKENLEDIDVIRSWPGCDGEWKTPTRVAYASENTKLGLTENMWGYQVEPRMVSCSWTKLLLDQNTKANTVDDPNIREAIDEGRLRLPPGQNAEQVAADFLREVFKHVEKKLVKQLGRAIFDSTPMDCWLTVPAVWSDVAQNATKAAAKEAGFAARPNDSLNLITEPEAAAIAVLKDIARPDSLSKPQLGETVLICDCGGGTVDITSYVISQITPVPIFDEVCVGIGGKCGSTALDRSLYELMSKRFGAAWDDISAQRKGPGSKFMRDWEKVKKDFGTNSNSLSSELGPLNLKGVSDSAWYDEEEGTVKLSKDDIRKIFDPTVGSILKLLNMQKRAIEAEGQQLNRVVLCGGFGTSDYLYRQLKMWCAEKRIADPYCPRDPQAAIVRGAAFRGLVGMAPRKKKCRRHYGCVVNEVFRDGIDDPEFAEYDPFSSAKMCTNRMLWFMGKGEEVTEKTFASHPLTVTQKVKDLDKTAKLRLFSCGFDMPPEHLDLTRMESVGIVNIDWRFVNLGRLEERREFGFFGSRYHEVPVVANVFFGSKSGSLQIEAYCNGVKTGNADITFD